MNNIMDQLSQLCHRGVIEPIDLEFCHFLKKQEPNISAEVLKAACLTSYHYRQGDVCVSLEQYAGTDLFGGATERTVTAPDMDFWQEQLSQSALVGTPGAFRPLILDAGSRLYLHKLWHHENTLARTLLERCRNSEKPVDRELLQEGLQRLFSFPSESETDWQQVAAALAVKHNLSVISGGPGTGKTSTVVRILALLTEQGEARGEIPSIALTAPTGKAAARLQDAILGTKETLPVSDAVREAIPDEAVTLHQLMGARRHTAQFRHNSENPLPQDVIVIDEVSMVDQTLMSKLMEALLDDTRLILLGDKDQLASVEAGSVLGDICMFSENQFSETIADWLESLSLNLPQDVIADHPKRMTDYVTLLTKSYRFDKDSGIARLARAVNRGADEESMEILMADNYNEVTLINYEDISALKELLVQKVDQYFQQLHRCSSPAEAFEILQEFRILAAHRRGPRGIRHLNQLIEQILHKRGVIPKYQQWYAGKPVIVNVNDYSLGLYNGDTGICLPDEDDALRVYFQHDETVRAIAPSRLPDHNKAYALTVHKSQGSEFNHILLILPSSPSKIVSRELIYTAITRARRSVAVLARRDALQNGIRKRLQRTSGLADRLWN